MRIASVYGSAGPPGRLWSVFELVNEHLWGNNEVAQVSVRDMPAEWADGRPLADHSDEIRSAVAALHAADGCAIFTPIYRASVPGPLKNFLDLVPLEALENKPVLLVSVGAAADHRLAVEDGLRHVLAWFGAVPLPTPVYLTHTRFTAGDPDDDAGRELRRAADSLVALASRLRGVRLEPRPLAASWR